MQISDVIFPVFEIPESITKLLVLGSFIGLPLVLIFAWFFEITDQGIQLEKDLEKKGAKRLTIISSTHVIILLVVALSASLLVNFRSTQLKNQSPAQLVSILIADFNNQTGDPVFNGSLEEALKIGMEGASFVTSYNRNKALKVANTIKAGDNLNEERARLVAVREGIDLVFSGSISQQDGEYLLQVNAIDPLQGKIVSNSEAEAKDKLSILQAVGSVAAQLREALGDANIDSGALNGSETFTAGSLKAIQLYTQAQKLAQTGEYEKAAELYQQATIEDDQFGRAYSGWALSEFKLGQREKAQGLWEKTLTLLPSMTEREKFRTLGLYYMRVSNNYLKAIENYQQLVAQFPGDEVGLSNLAVAHFMERQFKQALRVGKDAAQKYPTATVLNSNYALYAMYAGDFNDAKKAADKLLTEEKIYFKSYLPLAMAHLASGDWQAARLAYDAMALLGNRGASLSAAGLADIAMTQGDFKQAVTLLETGIEEDRQANSSYSMASKSIMLAQSLQALGQYQDAEKVLKDLLATSPRVSQKVAAALILPQLGSPESAFEVAAELAKNLQKDNRAYADLILASIALSKNKPTAAVDSLQNALKKTDMWLVRFELGKAYTQAGAYAEAFSEFELCQKRIGETTSLYLDDLPTFNQSVELEYWLGRVQQQLGIGDSATSHLQSFLSLTKGNSPLAKDASERLKQLIEKLPVGDKPAN